MSMSNVLDRGPSTSSQISLETSSGVATTSNINLCEKGYTSKKASKKSCKTSKSKQDHETPTDVGVSDVLTFETKQEEKLKSMSDKGR
ncbi:hypothetical protein SNE40_013055 [Patella caerulea]|uniref:Uncharacterized protein n=1 Tax=Patella caerulea TaxID=87958 RepID=A0AAN8JIW9_PATCE